MITKSLFSWEEREDWMHRGWKELTASLQLAFISTQPPRHLLPSEKYGIAILERFDIPGEPVKSGGKGT